VKNVLFSLLLTSLCLRAEAVQEPSTEVVFVGTQHFISDMPPGYTPAHLRVLLSKIHPSTLAVEAPANVKNPWESAPLELQWVTKPWADQHQMAVVPIGWNDLFYQARTQTMIGAIQKAGKGDEFQRLEGRFQGELSAGVTCEDLNGEKGIALWRQYHRALHELYGKDTPWELVNSKILDNLRGLLRENRGKRLAIVFGAAHGYFLLDALSKEEGVKTLPCHSFFPLPEKDIAGQTTPKDHLLALRFLNFGVNDPKRLEELGKHLDQIKNVKGYEGDHVLFSGKRLLSMGDFEGARARFEKVASLGDEEVSAFDGTTRLNEAGALYAAIALSRLGKKAEAQDRVNSLLKKAGLSPPMKEWAHQILRELSPKK
jgi:hypothetical protein